MGRVPELISVKEAAELLYIKKTKLYQLIKEPDCTIDVYMPGGKKMIGKKSAIAWLLSTKVTHTPKQGAPRKR